MKLFTKDRVVRLLFSLTICTARGVASPKSGHEPTSHSQHSFYNHLLAYFQWIQRCTSHTSRIFSRSNGWEATRQHVRRDPFKWLTTFYRILTELDDHPSMFYLFVLDDEYVYIQESSSHMTMLSMAYMRSCIYISFNLPIFQQGETIQKERRTSKWR